MRYIVSDVHGCYMQLMQLLHKINFGDDDELYVLGDAVDRGPEPIQVLRYMMRNPNVHFILGNHDFYMFCIFRKLFDTYQDISSDDDFSKEDLEEIMAWAKEGGAVTISEFLLCDTEEQMEILEYIANASLYETIEYDGKEFVLVHAGIKNYEMGKALSQYELEDFIHDRVDYSKPVFEEANRILVTGHTPTPLIRPDGRPYIYEGNGHLALDCGCVFGGNLAAYCIETGEAFYVRGKRL